MGDVATRSHRRKSTKNGRVGPTPSQSPSSPLTGARGPPTPSVPWRPRLRRSTPPAPAGPQPAASQASANNDNKPGDSHIRGGKEEKSHSAIRETVRLASKAGKSASHRSRVTYTLINAPAAAPSPDRSTSALGTASAVGDSEAVPRPLRTRPLRRADESESPAPTASSRRPGESPAVAALATSPPPVPPAPAVPSPPAAATPPPRAGRMVEHVRALAATASRSLANLHSTPIVGASPPRSPTGNPDASPPTSPGRSVQPPAPLLRQSTAPPASMVTLSSSPAPAVLARGAAAASPAASPPAVPSPLTIPPPVTSPSPRPPSAQTRPAIISIAPPRFSSSPQQAPPNPSALHATRALSPYGVEEVTRDASRRGPAPLAALPRPHVSALDDDDDDNFSWSAPALPPSRALRMLTEDFGAELRGAVSSTTRPTPVLSTLGRSGTDPAMRTSRREATPTTTTTTTSTTTTSAPAGAAATRAPRAATTTAAVTTATTSTNTGPMPAGRSPVARAERTVERTQREADRSERERARTRTDEAAGTRGARGTRDGPRPLLDEGAPRVETAEEMRARRWENAGRALAERERNSGVTVSRTSGTSSGTAPGASSIRVPAVPTPPAATPPAPARGPRARQGADREPVAPGERRVVQTNMDEWTVTTSSLDDSDTEQAPHRSSSDAPPRAAPSDDAGAARARAARMHVSVVEQRPDGIVLRLDGGDDGDAVLDRDMGAAMQRALLGALLQRLALTQELAQLQPWARSGADGGERTFYQELMYEYHIQQQRAMYMEVLRLSEALGVMGDAQGGALATAIRNSIREQTHEPEAKGLSTEQLARIPAESMPRRLAGQQCSICLDGMELGELSRALPCSHRFHDGCIVQWLQGHTTCPNCRLALDDAPKK